jgi:hypothetical protein
MLMSMMGVRKKHSKINKIINKNRWQRKQQRK